MKHWRLVTLSCLVLLATPFACDLERQAEFPDEGEQLEPASGTVVPEQPVTSEAPAAVSRETPERSQAKVQQAKAKTQSKRKAPAAATDNPYGATGEGVVGVVVDGGEPAHDAGSAAKHVTDGALPDRADEAASPTSADSAIAPQPQQDAAAGAGEASAGADDEETDDGSWF